MKIGIIFAMKEELLEFKKNIKDCKENKIFNLVFYESKYKDNNIIFVESGIGKVNAARTCQILIDNYKPDYVFNVGVAGGIDKDLNILDTVIGDKLVQHDFNIMAFNHERGYIPEIGVLINSDDYLVKLSQKCLDGAKTGIIASGDIFVTDTEMSKKINKKFNALCVEMEGAAIAEVCYLCKVPFLVLRSISDTPNNKNEITFEEFLEESSNIISNNLLKILDNLSK